jgi:hypothetical protein
MIYFGLYASLEPPFGEIMKNLLIVALALFSMIGNAQIVESKESQIINAWLNAKYDCGDVPIQLGLIGGKDAGGNLDLKKQLSLLAKNQCQSLKATDAASMSYDCLVDADKILENAYSTAIKAQTKNCKTGKFSELVAAAAAAQYPPAKDNCLAADDNNYSFKPARNQKENLCERTVDCKKDVLLFGQVLAAGNYTIRCFAPKDNPCQTISLDDGCKLHSFTKHNTGVIGRVKSWMGNKGTTTTVPAGADSGAK